MFLHYENVTFRECEPYTHKTGLIVVGTLTVEIFNGDSFHKRSERLMFKNSQGAEVFLSWWALAREHGAI